MKAWSLSQVVGSVQLLSCVWLFATPRTTARQASLSPTPGVYASSSPLSRWCHPTISFCHPLLPLLPSAFPGIRVFSNESALRIRWPKYWSFSFNVSPCNEHWGLISSRMDWLGLLAVQGTLKSLLQHHSSKASILRRSAFFIVQLAHPYMTTGKTIASMRRTFVGKVVSLLFRIYERDVFELEWLLRKLEIWIYSCLQKGELVSHSLAWGKASNQS